MTKKRFIDLEEAKEIEKYRIIYRKLCHGEHVTIAVESLERSLDELFKNYVQVFLLFKERGMLEIKHIDSITNEDFLLID